MNLRHIFSLLCLTILATVVVPLGGYIQATEIDSTRDEWSWISPSVTGNNLYNVSFRGAMTGWAVGEYGAFLSTQDGGKTWQSHTDKTFRNHYAIVEHNGVLWMGSKGNLSRSLDNGNSWEEKFFTNGKAIHSIEFVDDLSGIACGDSGLILKTSDGGDNWHAIDTVLTSYPLLKVEFASDSVAFACGGIIGEVVSFSYGVILRTTDRGVSWNTVLSDSMIVYDIDFVSLQRGWGTATKLFDNTGRRCYILKTTDIGITWEKAELPGYPFEPSFDNISFIDDLTGWACGIYGVIMKTTDGGLTWNYQGGNYEAPDLLTEVVFNDANNGWCIGTNGAIIFTTNGGVMWEQSGGNTIGHTTFKRISFVSPDTGWIFPNGYPYKTTNAGENWGIDSSLDAQAMDFMNGQVGWAAGYGGHVYKTSDGGRVWEPQVTNISSDLKDICFATEQVGWTVSRDSVFKSTDGGKTWVRQQVYWTRFSAIFRIVILDSLRVWLYGTQHARTTNGGDTWIIIDNDPNWILPPFGSKGTMTYKLGNVSWSGSTTAIIRRFDNDSIPEMTFETDVTHQLWDLYFLDSTHGWAVGTWTVLRYGYSDHTVGVKLILDQTHPSDFLLYQNFPNPFNPSTKIEFDLIRNGFVSLRVYDVLGREVVTLMNGFQNAGSKTVSFDASNFSSGVYFYRLNAGKYTQVKKMLLLK